MSFRALTARYETTHGRRANEHPSEMQRPEYRGTAEDGEEVAVRYGRVHDVQRGELWGTLCEVGERLAKVTHEVVHFLSFHKLTLDFI